MTVSAPVPAESTAPTPRTKALPEVPTYNPFSPLHIADGPAGGSQSSVGEPSAYGRAVSPSPASPSRISIAQPYAAMSDALRDWLQRHVTEDFEAKSLVASMVQSGYDRTFARRVVDEALTAHAPASVMASAPTPAADEATENGNTVYTADDDIPILFAIETPHIMLFQHFLSGQKCDELITIGRNRLKRSPVVDPDTGEENLISARTSQGGMSQIGERPLIAEIEAHIAQAVGVPVEHDEDFRVLNYRPGGKYQPHFDFFNPGHSGEAHQLEVDGQHMATMVIYLNSMQTSGATGFPKLRLEVAPVKGNVVFFVYKRPNGTLDEDTLHASLSVEYDERWIITK